MRSEPRTTRARRWLRRLGFAVAVLVMMVLVGWRVLESRWAEERIRLIIVEQAREALAARLEIGELSGSVLGDVTLSNVGLTLEGQPVVTADAIRVRYEPWLMLGDRIVIESVEVTNPRVTLADDGRGWNVARLTRPQPSDPRAGARTSVMIDRLSLTGGTVDVASDDGSRRRLKRVELDSRLAVRDGTFELDVRHAAATDAGTSVRLVDLALDVSVDGNDATFDDIRARLGTASITGRVVLPRTDRSPSRFSLTVDGLEAGVLRAYVPALTMVPLTAVISASTSGTTTLLDAQWAMRSPEGDVEGTTRAAFASPAWQLTGELSASDWMPAAWFPGLDDLKCLEASGVYDATIPAGSVDEATVTFDVVAPDVAYDVYQATGVRARGSFGNRRIRARVSGSAYGATVTGDVAYDTQAISFAASGRFDNADLRRLPSAMAAPVLESGLSGEYTLASANDVWDVDIRLDESTLEGATVSAGSTVRAHVTPDGFAGSVTIGVRQLDPVRFAGLVPDQSGLFARLEGSVDATVVADIDVPEAAGMTDLEGVTASAHVTVTGASIADTRFSEITADAALASGRMTVRTLQVASREISGTASGSVVIAGPGESDLSFDLSVADLSLFEPLMGRRLAGTLTTSGRLTGTADRLEVVGRAQVTQLQAEPVSALSVVGTFSATVPALDIARATGRAESTATFVEVGRTRIDEIQGMLEYDGAAVDIEATLASEGRSLEFSGLLRPRPDERALLVRRLVVENAGDRWALEDGRTATVRYGTSRFALEDFALRNGDARMTIDGVLSAETDETLVVTARKVALGGLAIWLPGGPTVTGDMEGTVTIGGSPADPRVEADLRVDQGSVGGTSFQAMAARASYAKGRLTLDARLDAGPLSNLTVAGGIPLPFGEADRTGAPYDLTVRSTDIDLALLQPILPQVERLGGTGRIEVRVTGTAPDIEGSVTLADAVFRLPATGVTYSGIAADVSVAGRRLIVRQLRLEDGDGHAARIEGTASVPGDGLPDEFDLRVVADDLRVLDNDLGDVSVSTELQVMGDLTTPLVVGTIRVDRGLLEVDRLLDRLDGGYEAATDEPVDLADAGPRRRASVSITLDIPDNVVIRGRDLRTRGSGPLGFGDINVTVGGALSIAKDVGEDTSVLGRMNVVRGHYQFQGRPFTIARGSRVQFRGDPLDPSLDVEAERIISGVVASVHLAGSPRRPVITLTSQPPLDQGDILSLIVFNQSMNQLPTDQRVSLAARAGALAAGSVAAPISDSVARALNLDQFDIRPNETGASVLVGRQVSDRLFVGFRHDFGDSDVSQVSFEYRLNEFLRIVTSLAQGTSQSRSVQRADAAGLDLIFVIR